MDKNKHSYFKDEIQHVLILNAVIPVILLVMMGLLSFVYIYKVALIDQNRSDFEKISYEIEETIEKYRGLLNRLEKEATIQNQQISVTSRTEIFEDVYAVNNDVQSKANFYYFDTEINALISSTAQIPYYIDGITYKNWGVFRFLNEHPNDMVIKLENDSDIDIMQMLLGKTVIKNGEIIGYLLLVIDSRQFHDLMHESESQVVVTDSFDYAYMSSNEQFISRTKKFVHPDRSGILKTHNSQRYYLTSNSIYKGQIKIYTITPLQNQIDIFLGYGILLLLIFILMVLAIRINSRRIAEQKTHKLYKLLSILKKAENGDWEDYPKSQNDEDEFDAIGQVYQNMMDSLKLQVEKNNEMNQLIIDAQRKHLEAQFNPHFLMNTLENIRFMCRIDPESASKMSFYLSTLLRYSIDSSNNENSLKEDLYYINNYLSILKLRFNQRFNYSIDMEPGLEEQIIPKLVLQPLIENAVKYGFEGKNDLNVAIHIYHYNNLLIIECGDDGCGINIERLQEIQKILEGKTNGSKHKGLYNIHRRIRIQYGDGYGIEVDSKISQGTKIAIYLPWKNVQKES